MATAALFAGATTVASAKQSISARESLPTPSRGQTASEPANVTRMLFRHAGGADLVATSSSYDRAQVSPLIATLNSFPHGSELSKLGLEVGTPAEVTERCGEEAMSCYDPREDEMVVDGEDGELDGVSRTSLIAHEYGHHIAENRAGGIWSAFEAGTLRWSTYEEVCERTREGKLFPGNEGGHYWENPGEAFAQTYATLVEPETAWPYTPLLAPDETALSKVREDVLDPVQPRRLTWQVGSPSAVGDAIGEAMPVESGSLARLLDAPYDGRITVRLQAQEDGRYRVALRDPSTGELLAQAPTGPDGASRLHYADCGHRVIEVTAESLADPAAGFIAEILTP
jgi:hypothetical protein